MPMCCSMRGWRSDGDPSDASCRPAPPWPRYGPHLTRSQHLGLVSIVVADYDASIAFYVDRLGFQLVEDTPVPAQDKRWVVVAPPGATGASLLLAKATTPQQRTRIGDQTGGRVFLFLYADDFARDFALYRARGVAFVRGPSTEPYGTVAVFRDDSGNLWDLIEPRVQTPV